MGVAVVRVLRSEDVGWWEIERVDGNPRDARVSFGFGRIV
jgi:hypothetical protein